MATSEPAYSLLHDHNGLDKVIIEIDNDTLLRELTPGLLNPLNDSQKGVFNYSFNNKVTLLWGPPGTGKTTTLAAILAGWVLYANLNNVFINIAIGSSTWTAIDNLLNDIDKTLNNAKAIFGEKALDINIYRIRSSAGEAFENENIEDVVVYSESADLLKKELDKPTGINICGSTWKQYYNLSKSDRRSRAKSISWFDLLLIDEASQVKVEYASAYFLYLKKSGHLILAGDDKQLGPIHGFQMENKLDGLFDCIYTFMKETHQVVPQTIVDNYRSNWNINDWPNKRFYNGELTSQNPENKLGIKMPTSKPENWPEEIFWNDDYLNILDPSCPIVVVTYPSSIHTVSNSFEAQIVAGICCLYRIILGTEVSESDFIENKIGIVTPHRAQRSQIQNLLISSDIPINDGGFIDTVDRFQGQERDLIVCSYSVSDKDFVTSEESFILDSKRFNVSLTRAKSKFIMLVSDALIDHLSNDRDIAEDASHLQMFVVKFCKNESDITLKYLESENLKEMNCRINKPCD